MARYRALVFTNAAEDADEAFNRWYDDVHAPEVLQLTKASAVQRFALSDFQTDEPGEQRYLAIYEFDCPPAEFRESLMAGAPQMKMSEALDQSSARVIFYDVLGERLAE